MLRTFQIVPSTSSQQWLYGSRPHPARTIRSHSEACATVLVMYGGSSTFSDSDPDSLSDESDGSEALPSLSAAPDTLPSLSTAPDVTVVEMAAETEETVEAESFSVVASAWRLLTMRSMRLKTWYSGI